MKNALYPGSFDPVTNGHIDIIKRAAKLFDTVYVCIATNPNKKCLFSKDERVELMKKALANYKNVEVVSTEKLTVEKAKELNCTAIIRGLRAVTDFEFEFQLAAGYKFIDKEIEMVFLMSSSELSFISSSAVKEFAENHVDVSLLVPRVVELALEEKYKE